MRQTIAIGLMSLLLATACQDRAAEAPDPAQAPAADAPSSGALPSDGASFNIGSSDFKTLEEAERGLRESEAELLKVFSQEASPMASGDPRCDRACRAFDSLRRSADAVCRLAEDASRCERAKGIVEKHRPSLSACACPE